MTIPPIACIVGARPNFMKMAPILRAFEAYPDLPCRLIHTGQHYDAAMSDVFFDQLAMRRPDVNLGIGSGSQTVQTATAMMALEGCFAEERPAMVLVVGDVNSTLAAALVAAKMGIDIAHVEAGLRSFDRTMPEEINRLVVDRLSTLLFTTERKAQKQLVREGTDAGSVHFVGNVMIDSVHHSLKRAVPAEEVLRAQSVPNAFIDRLDAGYGLVTLHRPSNVDDPAQLAGLLDVLSKISERLPLVFTLHPRTAQRIEAAGLAHHLDRASIATVAPLGYLEMLGVVRQAGLVITDSGGLQEETTALGVPCLTVRDNTERPITIEEGTNTLVGRSPDALAARFDEFTRSGGKTGRVPELWDGAAATRIAAIVARHLKGGEGR